MQTNVSDDVLAKEIAAVLLENVQPHVQRNEIQDTLATKQRDLLRSASPNSSAPTPGGLSVVGLGSRCALDVEEPELRVVPNKFETCAPLVSGGTPLGTPLLLVGPESIGTSVSTPSASSATGLNSAHSMLSQYLGTVPITRRHVEPQYPPVLQQTLQQGSQNTTEEVQHLMRQVEDEKRKNRRLTSTVQVLDREVSLFRNRRQVFVTVVGFKLFNPLQSKASETISAQGSRVAPDEHVEFFIVVDKSIAPKYLVRHRYNHFKALHKMLEKGAFRVPKPTRHTCTHANVGYIQESDGRTTPWQVGGYYNAPPANEHSSDEESDSDSDSSSLATPTSVGAGTTVPQIKMQRPSSLRLQRAIEMIPSLPRRDKRRPSAGVSGLIHKIGKKFGSKPDEGKSNQKLEGKMIKRAQKLEQEMKYRSYMCEATGIPEEDLPFFERRAKELEVYLRQLLSIELFADSDVMAAFLQPDHELFIEHPKPHENKSKSRSSSVTRSATASEGSLVPRAVSQNVFLAPPAASHSGRISPGGDYIISNANLAILMGDAVPPPPPETAGVSQTFNNQNHSARSGHTPLQTPLSTPFMSQNLPPQQQALAIAHQYPSSTTLGLDSGPLDIPHVSAPPPPKRPTVRVDKKAMVAMLGGRGSQRFTPAHVMMGQPAPQPPKTPEIARSPVETIAPSETNDTFRKENSQPSSASLTLASAPQISNPQFQHLIVRPTPSPIPTPRAVSPFTAMFSTECAGQPYVNPNVVAFSTLVIVADESNRYPTMLGLDALADHRAIRQRERGAAVVAQSSSVGRTASMSSRSHRGSSPVSEPFSIALEKSAYALPNISRNGNFLLLLSALGFNQVPVYSTTAASHPNNTQGIAMHSNRSMTPMAAGCTPMRGPVAPQLTSARTMLSQYNLSHGAPATGASPFPSYYSNYSSTDVHLPSKDQGASLRSQHADEAGSSPSSGLPSNMSAK